MDLKGMVFDIQRFSVQDGPGIRTTVFLKGCPLRCVWCHNPESFTREPVILYWRDICVRCGTCHSVCPQKAWHATNQGMALDRKKCISCGRCAEFCPTEAIKLSGREMTIQDVMTEITRDGDYYRASGGGITVSGGEPTQQTAFAAEILRQSKQSGFHTTLDTSGFTSWSNLALSIAWADLVLYDLKCIDKKRHKELTGQGNEIVLDNLKRVLQQGKSVWIRSIIVPGLNDEAARLEELADYIKKLYKEIPEARIERIDLMPYHQLGRGKYRALDLSYSLENLQPPSESRMAEIEKMFRELIPYVN